MSCCTDINGLAFVMVMVASVVLYLKKRFKSLKEKKKTKKLLIFSRYPTPGNTKTRLIPELGAEGASYAQLLMTNHLLDNIEHYYTKDNDVVTEMYYNGGSEDDVKYWLERRKCDIAWQKQADGGLGDKLASAFKDSFKRGSKFTVILGSDIPGINSSIISEAYRLLQSGSEIVLGPAADGGYYLVGLSNKVLDQIDDLFSGINWGTETVLKEQSEKAKSLGLSRGILKRVLNDVDLPEDLPVLERELQITKLQIKNPKLSIIIPAYNEADNIQETLQVVLENCMYPKSIAEIVISDGGSTDNTTSIVKSYASKTKDVSIKVVNSPPGRGFQQKVGAEHATGDVFLFLHADTIVPRYFDQKMYQCLRKPGVTAGYFELGLDVVQFPERAKDISRWFLYKMKKLENFAKNRCRYFELPFGDQMLSMTRQNYFRVGGFKAVYLLEDYIMVRSFHKIGHVRMAEGGPAITSARRFEKFGVGRMFILNRLIIYAYELGVSPDTLAYLYYGRKLNEIKKRAKLS